MVNEDRWSNFYCMAKKEGKILWHLIPFDRIYKNLEHLVGKFTLHKVKIVLTVKDQ